MAWCEEEDDKKKIIGQEKKIFCLPKVEVRCFKIYFLNGVVKAKLTFQF